MTNYSPDIRVTVEAQYIDEHSDEAEEQFVFSYTVTIENIGEDTVKLISRYWQITDANGELSTVAGEGVVGKQPILRAGGSYTYTSGCILKTPFGTMEGHYQFLNDTQKPVQGKIPLFRLSKPNLLH